MSRSIKDSKLASLEDDIDFTALSLQDANFAHIMRMNMGFFDFHKPDHVKQLTKTLLKLNFGLQISLPDDRLCPPVPVRYHYVHWIQDLIDSTSRSFTEQYEPDRVVTGLDIGVGSSNIYSLLALTMRPAWRMCGTDIDDTNFQYASSNTKANSLSNRMHLLQTTTSDALIPLDQFGAPRLDFTICNPPFFIDNAEMLASLSGENKGAPPSAVCTGAEVEMVTKGGDVGFVLRMIDESMKLQEKVQWYSSMLGKYKSLEIVVEKLKELGIENTAVTALRAGGKTTRWAVAWSFGDLRPANDVARRDMVVHNLLPFPTEYLIPLEGKSTTDAAHTINETMNDLDLRWVWNSEMSIGVALAQSNVWSRAARREFKRRKEVANGDESVQNDDDVVTSENAILGVKISVGQDQVTVRWLKGNDRVLYESFRGMLHRKLAES